jgi:hypothetical protein
MTTLWLISDVLFLVGVVTPVGILAETWLAGREGKGE